MNIVELLREMNARQASDLFLAVGKRPHLRVFGALQELAAEAVTEGEFRDFLGQHLPSGVPVRLEAERDLDIGLSLGEDERYRLNLFYQKGRLALVARRVPSGALEFAELGIPPAVAGLAESPRGLVLITGATGSGKSSTMAAILHYINQRFPRHVVTIEDPIEFVHQDLKSVITQREVGNDTRNFAEALKHVVRQSPDVVFIGEMRDLETIQTALSAAMTGHLVVSTMHTVDVSQTLERIVNYFPEHLRDQVAMDLGMALRGVISQRLLPRKDGKGLVPVFEILVQTPLGRQLITERRLGEIDDVIKTGAAEGMMTFTRSLVDQYRAGLISLEVGAGAATNRDAFLLAVQGMETGIDTLRDQGAGGGVMAMTMKQLLRAAVKHGASDLLLTVGSAPVLRINGALNELNLAPLAAADTQHLLFSVLSPAQRARFENEREVDFALSISSIDADVPEEIRGNRFRVNGFYQKGNIAVALRVIRQQVPTPQELGLPPVILDLAERHQGLVLVTGPTGHGKSTTLACLIDLINRNRSCHIITVEDPIEYVHHNQKAIVEQREVYADTKSFAAALKYVLRQDPDVILIGEMRDPETISAALTAAETGHLVLATLHTNDAAQTVDRIIDSFPPHQQNQVRAQLAAALTAVVSERLLPRADGNGRVAAFEVMLATTAIRSLIRDNRTHQILATIETSAKDGMITLDKALQNLYNRNQISRQTLKTMARNFESV